MHVDNYWRKFGVMRYEQRRQPAVEKRILTRSRKARREKMAANGAEGIPSELKLNHRGSKAQRKKFEAVTGQPAVEKRILTRSRKARREKVAANGAVGIPSELKLNHRGTKAQRKKFEAVTGQPAVEKKY